MAALEARAANLKTLGFALAGLALFALPFLSMGVGTRHHRGGEAHMDHAPRYGGLLLMVDDHHLELIETGPSIAIYVSDAKRIPLRPASGSVRIADDTDAIPLVWESDHLTAHALPRSPWVDVEVTLVDGTLLAIRVPRS